MTKLLKILFGIVIALVVIVAVAAVLIPRFVDVNALVRSQLPAVEKATGRKLAIDGNINASVFPWLGASLEKVAFGNAPEFGASPMFSADKLNVRVQLLPLLRKEVLLDTIVAEGVTVNLARDANGRTNFDDLTGGKKESSQGGTQLAALVLNGLELRNANITWNDQQKNEKYSATNLNLSTGKLNFDESIPVTLRTDFDASPKGVAGNVALDGEFELSKDMKHVQLDPLNLSGKLNGKAIPGGSSDIDLKTTANVDLNAGTVKLSDFDFTGFGTTAHGNIDASDISSGKPIANGKIALNATDVPALFSLVNQFAPAQAAKLQSLAAAGKELKLNAGFDVDMKTGTAKLDDIDFAGLGATLSGNVDAQGIGAGIPTAKGHIAMTSADLPALLNSLAAWVPLDKVATILKPYQVEPTLAHDVKLDTGFDVNAQSGLAKVDDLKLHAFGSDVSGSVDAKNLQTGKPVASGSISVKSDNGPALITALTGKKIAAGAKKLTLDTAFDVDMGADTATLKDLKFEGLDASASGEVSARGISTGKPAANGTLTLASSNAPAMLQSLTGKMLPAGSGNDLKASGTFNVDMASGFAKVQNLDFVGLGSTIKGDIDARNIQSKQPAIAGTISVDSKNGPALVSLATGKPVPAAAGDLKLNTAMNVDLAAGYAKLTGLNLNTMGTTVTGDVDAKDINGKNSSVVGKLNINSADVSALLKAYGQASLPVSVTNLVANANIAGTAQKFQLNPINATARVSGPGVPQGASDIKLVSTAAVDLGADTLSMSNLSFSALGLNATGSVDATSITKSPQLSGKLSVGEFDLRQFMTTLGKQGSLPVMADSKTLTRVAISSGFTGSTNSISLNGMAMKLDDSNIKGDLAIANFADPSVSFNLNIDALNADRYLPPVAEAAAGGDSGAAAAPAAPAAPSKIPLDTLRKLKVKGDANIGSLVVKKARLSGVHVSINARDGDVQLNPIAAKLYEGTYKGAIGINAKGNAAVLRLDHSLTGIQIEPLLKDMKGKAKMRGKGDFSLHASGSGADSAQITRSLNGDGGFIFRNGAIKGFNIAKFLRRAENLFVGDTPTEETDFTELTGTYKITNGVVSNNDLAAKSPLLRLGGEGTADLVSSKLDYQLKTTLVSSTEGQGGEDLGDLGGVTIPIKVAGTFDKPTFAPDVAGIAKAKAEKLLEKQLEKNADKLPVPKELLEGVLGKKQAPAEGAAEGATTEGEAAPAKKSDPTKQLLEGLLGKKKKGPPPPEEGAPTDSATPAEAAPPPSGDAPPPAEATAPAENVAPPAGEEPPPPPPKKKKKGIDGALDDLLKGL